MTDRRKNILEKLQEEVVIPKQVQDKANKTLESIMESSKTSQTYQTIGRKKISRKRIVVLAAAATLVLGTVTIGATALMNWSRSLEDGLQVSEEDKQMIEAKNMNTFVGESVTDNGITVTAQQSISDEHYAIISFKVEGYDLPEGSEPFFEFADCEVEGMSSETSDDSSKYLDVESSFYDGLVMGANGETMKADGTTIDWEKEENPFAYVQEDGSMEYRVRLSNDTESDNLVNKNIRVTLRNLGTVEKAEFLPDVKGTWEFQWTLQGSSETRDGQLDVPLEDTDATVLSYELSPISARVQYQYPRSYEEETFVDENGVESTDQVLKTPPLFTGVRMKDGTCYFYLADGGMEGYVSEDSDTFQVTNNFTRIIDVTQVDSLLFLKNQLDDGATPTEDDFYVVPLGE